MWEDMMAPGRRLYRGSEMAAILQGEGIPPENIEAFLTSTAPSPTCFGGLRPAMNFEPVCGSTTPDRRPLLPHHPSAYTPPSAATMMVMNDSDLEYDCGFLPQQHPHTSSPADPKKRRLSAEQVQFLEHSFEAENKLEPERKAEIARSLGLQPRQVAIWFQNRRARWKTKQLERDYEAVRAGFEGLKREYEVARNEKEKLEAEVNYLRQQLLNRQQKRRGSGTSVDSTPDNEILCQRLRSTTSEGKMKINSETEASPLIKQEEMLPLLHDEPAETDQSELDHAEEDDLVGVVAAAAAACRYVFPTAVDDHHSSWPWHPAEFCGP